MGAGSPPVGKARVLDLVGPIVNFSVAIFGAGFVATPLTATQMGLLLASLCLLGVGLLNAYACTLLLVAAEDMGAPESYHDLTHKVLGKRWALLLDAFIVLASLFACTQRLILVGDFGVAIKHRIITHKYEPVRPLIVLLLTAVLAAPLSYALHLRKVEKVTFVALLCLATVIGIVIYTLAATGLPTGQEIVYANWSPNMLLALPTQEFAYAGQQAVLPIYRELKNRSLRRGKLVVYISYSTCALVYVGFCIIGYLQYPGALEADFFNLYEEKPGALYTAMYFLLIIGVIGSFPVSVFIGRLHLGYLVVGREKSEQPRWAYLMATLFLLSSCGIAVGIKNLGVVQGVGGGLGNSFINLVVPAFALLAMLRKHGPKPSKGQPSFNDVESGKSGKEEDNGEGAASSKDAGSGRDLADQSVMQLGKGSEGVGRFRSSSWAGEEVDRSSSNDVSKQPQCLDLPVLDNKDNDLKKEAPAGHDPSSLTTKDKIRLRLRQLPAFFLLAVALLQVSVATVGNIVSLVLVGWDNASNKFY